MKCIFSKVSILAFSASLMMSCEDVSGMNQLGYTHNQQQIRYLDVSNCTATHVRYHEGRLSLAVSATDQLYYGQIPNSNVWYFNNQNVGLPVWHSKNSKVDFIEYDKKYYSVCPTQDNTGFYVGVELQVVQQYQQPNPQAAQTVYQPQYLPPNASGNPPQQGICFNPQSQTQAVYPQQNPPLNHQSALQYPPLNAQNNFGMPPKNQQPSIQTMMGMFEQPAIFSGVGLMKVTPAGAAAPMKLECVHYADLRSGHYNGSFMDLEKLQNTNIVGFVGGLFQGYNFGPNFSFPQYLRDIGDMCFSGSNIVHVTLPTNVNRIGTGCFAYCAQLQDIAAGDVTTIPLSCFYDCPLLKNVDMQNVIFIMMHSFKRCTALTQAAQAAQAAPVPAQAQAAPVSAQAFLFQIGFKFHQNMQFHSSAFDEQISAILPQ